MRRREREVTERAELEAILGRARVCRLGLVDRGEPYVVPLCFGYRDGALYFHSSPKGRKLDAMRRSPRVCFEADTGIEVVPGKVPCRWGMAYESVIVWGRASLVEDPVEKRRALGIVMEHYGGRPPFEFPEGEVGRVAVIRVDVERMSGKRAGMARKGE
jgi:nitroimidazol reductase NimA-like FMN-containing flavoprotein (pyridoxamine 5'-phosphate oxidase superfamily)